LNGRMMAVISFISTPWVGSPEKETPGIPGVVVLHQIW
jgi:hypothetical protein